MGDDFFNYFYDNIPNNICYVFYVVVTYWGHGK